MRNSVLAFKIKLLKYYAKLIRDYVKKKNDCENGKKRELEH